MSTLRRTTDPYLVLGLARDADVAQVKAAHRRLAKRHHPDSGGDEQRFLAVQEAYRLLSDPLRRREWDRQHAPGPVDARHRAQRPRSRSASARWTREDTETYRRSRPPRRGAEPESGPRRPEEGGAGAPSEAGTRRAGQGQGSGQGRPPGVRRESWTAGHVPWWEDFEPRTGSGETTAPPAGPEERGPDAQRTRTATGSAFDVFDRSSGAAWSAAARRHFRRDAEDLPSRGVFRYRGAQVVTGAEARKLAAEEAALFRRRPTVEPAPPQAFEHEPPVPDRGMTPGATPVRTRVAPPVATRAAPPVATGAAPAVATDAGRRPPARSRSLAAPVARGPLGALVGATALGAPLAGLAIAAGGTGSEPLLLWLALPAVLLGAAAGYVAGRRSEDAARRGRQRP